MPNTYLICYFCRIKQFLLLLLLAWVETTSAVPDMVLLLDNNGSRWQQQTATEQGELYATLFSGLDSPSLYAIFTFDDYTETIVALSSIPANVALEVSRHTAAMDYQSNFRNTAAAVERAIEVLQTREQQRPAAIVLVSSGPITTGDSSRDKYLTRWLKELLSADARAANIAIHSISTGTSPDPENILLSHLANATGGAFRQAGDLDSLRIAIDSIAHNIYGLADATQEEAVAQIQIPISEPIPEQTPEAVPEAIEPAMQSHTTDAPPAPVENRPTTNTESVTLQPEGSIAGIQIHIPVAETPVEVKQPESPTVTALPSTAIPTGSESTPKNPYAVYPVSPD